MAFKKISALFACILPVFSASQGVSETSDQSIEDLKKQIQQSCAALAGTEDYDLCVNIVEMDFTIIPHNQIIRTGGGTCPNGQKTCQETVKTGDIK